MKIDAYSFGQIKINGNPYSSDLIIYPDRVDHAWWRTEGHRLQEEDLSEIVKARPDILVIGTGFFGVMSVPETTIEFLKANAIDTKVERTGKAVDVFNALQARSKRVIAALHLTC